MTIFSRIRSQFGGVLTITAPALGFGAGAVAKNQTEKAIKKNYPPVQAPEFKPGQKVMHNGREYTVLGYSGHRGDRAHNLILDGSREVWITEDLSVAQNYATQGGEGAVATVIALRKASSSYSRYENGYTPDLPKKDDDYQVIKVDPVTPENDTRFAACFSRMVEDLKSRFF